jgi:hypothetical protein
MTTPRGDSPKPERTRVTPDPIRKALTVRFAVIAVLAFLTGVAAGVLYWLATVSIPMAILTGGAALGTSWVFYDRLIA